MGDINAFIDHGFSEASTFARSFLNSPDFTVQTLHRILGKGSRGSKEELAGEVWRRLDNGDLDPLVVLLQWTAQPRRWLRGGFITSSGRS